MPQIMKATRQAIATLSVADAARTLATNADGVLLFRDADTRGISALYRNADGELVLVET
jgi:hypothetical protein